MKRIRIEKVKIRTELTKDRNVAKESIGSLRGFEFLFFPSLLTLVYRDSEEAFTFQFKLGEIQASSQLQESLEIGKKVSDYVMASSPMESGALVSLQDQHPLSPYLKQGASLRVTGKLQEFSVETAIATVVDGNDSLKIDTKNHRELSIRVGSMYQFIGELLIQPDNEAVLQARVGRNVDGIDVNLYHQSLQLLRQFQGNHLKNPTA